MTDVANPDATVGSPEESPPLDWRSRTIFGRGIVGEMAAEFLGTLLLILFGDGVVAMCVVALNQSGRAATKTTIFNGPGDWWLIVAGWGFAVMIGVYVANGVTGAHLNPAVTLGMAVRGALPWAKVLPYWIAQVVGAFVGAAIVFLLYHNAIDSYLSVLHVTQRSSNVATYSIFATFPAAYFHSVWGPLIDQIVGTATLLIGVCALTDRRNTFMKANLAPVGIAFVVMAIGASIGANAGYAINPARDFGPRLFAWIAGWGSTALPGNYANVDWYFWVPIVGPLVGGVVGVVVYDFFVKNVLIARGVKEGTDNT